MVSRKSDLQTPGQKWQRPTQIGDVVDRDLHSGNSDSGNCCGRFLRLRRADCESTPSTQASAPIPQLRRSSRSSYWAWNPTPLEDERHLPRLRGMGSLTRLSPAASNGKCYRAPDLWKAGPPHGPPLPPSHRPSVACVAGYGKCRPVESWPPFAPTLTTFQQGLENPQPPGPPPAGSPHFPQPRRRRVEPTKAE